MNFLDEIKTETKKYGGGGGGDYFEFKEGVNRMRLLAQPKVIAKHFLKKGERPNICVGIDKGCSYHKAENDKPSIKLATYIIDRDDADKVKMAELPLSISYGINDLQKDSDFAFSEFPMEYDIKVTHDPKNSDPKAKYRLTPSPNRAPVSDVELEAFNAAMAKMTPEQYVEKEKGKQTDRKAVDDVYDGIEEAQID